MKSRDTNMNFAKFAYNLYIIEVFRKRWIEISYNYEFVH